jgi:DNA repair photolyase
MSGDWLKVRIVFGCSSVTVTTKSDRVLQDLDLLAELARERLASVAISVTTLDPKLSGKLEPRAAAPGKRLAALGALAEAGVPAHCAIAPVIPAVTDEFMEGIVARAGELGVRSAFWLPVRLPLEVAPLFREWLSVHFPERGDKVMHIVQSIRGGRDNDPRFFSRMHPTGVWAELFRARFRLACKRAGLADAKVELDCTRFRPPEVGGQLRLF